MKRPSFLCALVLICLSATAQQPSPPATEKKIDTVKTYLLKDVSIKGSVPAVQIKTGKILFNVESLPTAAGLNALELLRQVPGVTVDGQDNVKISGKNGVQVLLDGRMQTLNAQQLSILLKGTSGASLKTIEVISNPSSKYDAAGNAGIINLIFKKSGANGLSGNVLAGYQKMQHYRQDNAVNLNLKSNGLTAFFNANLENSLQFTKVTSNRILSDKVLSQLGTERQGYSNTMVRSGIELKMSKRSKIGTIISFQRTWDDFPSNASTNVSGSNPDLLSTNALANLTENRFGVNLNYQLTGIKGEKFSIEGDWLRYWSSLGNNVNNIFSGTGQSSKSENDTQTGIDLFSIKADYTQKLGKANLESGLKFSSSGTANLLNGKQTSSNFGEILQINDFRYTEKIAAAYFTLEQTFGKFNFQAGLRGEFTDMKGISIDESGIRTNRPDSSYFNVFPTFFSRYQMNEKSSIGLAYSRRLGRPSFQDQNPYLYRTDFYYASRGNPLLLPQFTQSIELDYTFNGQTQIKVSYSSTSDLIEVIRTQQADQTLETPVNAGRRSFLNLSLSTPFKLLKAWSGYFSAEPYYQFYKADLSAYSGLSAIDQGGYGFNGYLSNTVDLGEGWKAGLSAWFNYASRSSIYATKPIYSVDFTLKKPIFNDRLNLSLAMRDIFNTQKWTQTAVLSNLNQTNSRKWESRGVYIGVNYNFGNKKIKSAGNGKQKTEEQERIKSRG
ncbi:hypothetical protein DHW03_05835 [Pedobacter yonginense]|uniref:Outer membrane protein beta-barrel domain-containing protein n=1 Tax=Pedobacter yonginense TaxID=651869 RepID=A0A317ERL9_9SPHI|nr:TonB-dependent receptor [Pedobacter yonginense]PWS29334.1 hypothetical protein DHW03_05835 [Pedobacter yonginense]